MSEADTELDGGTLLLLIQLMFAEAREATAVCDEAQPWQRAQFAANQLPSKLLQVSEVQLLLLPPPPVPPVPASGMQVL